MQDVPPDLLEVMLKALMATHPQTVAAEQEQHAAWRMVREKREDEERAMAFLRQRMAEHGTLGGAPEVSTTPDRLARPTEPATVEPPGASAAPSARRAASEVRGNGDDASAADTMVGGVAERNGRGATPADPPATSLTTGRPHAELSDAGSSRAEFHPAEPPATESPAAEAPGAEKSNVVAKSAGSGRMPRTPAAWEWAGRVLAEHDPDDRGIGLDGETLFNRAVLLGYAPPNGGPPSEQNFDRSVRDNATEPAPLFRKEHGAWLLTGQGRQALIKRMAERLQKLGPDAAGGFALVSGDGGAPPPVAR